MKKLLKKYGKKILIDSIVGAIIATIIAYVIVGPYNSEFTEILQIIASHDSKTEICIIIFLITLIINITINLGKVVVKNK